MSAPAALCVETYRCRKCGHPLFSADAASAIRELVRLIEQAAPAYETEARGLARAADVETVCGNRRCRTKQRISLVSEPWCGRCGPHDEGDR